MCAARALHCKYKNNIFCICKQLWEKQRCVNLIYTRSFSDVRACCGKLRKPSCASSQLRHNERSIDRGAWCPIICAQIRTRTCEATFSFIEESIFKASIFFHLTRILDPNNNYLRVRNCLKIRSFFGNWTLSWKREWGRGKGGSRINCPINDHYTTM